MGHTAPSPSSEAAPPYEAARREAARPPFAQTFRALRNPNYRLFWCGQIVSMVGTGMQRIAQAWLVLRLTNSPLALGVVTSCQMAPVLFFALFGGVIADRVPKRRLMLITQTTMLVQAAAMALITVLGWARLADIYLLAAVLGTANAVDNPTQQAFVKELVGAEDVPNAVALNSMIMNVARLAGPALGGITIALVGVAGCFTLNAVSFLAVIGGLLLMRPERFYEVANAPPGKVAAQIGEGLRYALRTPEIALVLLLIGVIGIFGYNFSIILPLIARYVLHTGPLGFGMLSTALAIGSLAAGMGIAYSGRVSERTLLAGAAGFSGLLLCLSLSTRWPATIAALITLGVFSIVFTATATSRLQLVTPSHLRGRVMSLYTLLFMGGAPIGSLTVGAMADHQGVRVAIAEMAAISACGTIAGLVYRVRQRHCGHASVTAPLVGDPARASSGATPPLP